MERLQKVIANSGYTSRRKAEELILKGKVVVNGEVVRELGTKVGPDDVILVEGVELNKEVKKVYYLLNKPRGYICSLNDEKGRKTVDSLIDSEERIYPVGRLDYDTTGLLILTNDGELANILMHPSNNVEKVYKTGVTAIYGLNLDIKKGDFAFIIGASGSGKSTLIKLLLRELVPTDGEITVLGYNLRKIKHSKIPKFRRNLGIVFQDFRLLKDRNVYENVAFAQRIVQTPTREIKRNVPSILATVNLAGKYKNKINQLSGGEQQRVALARALVNKPTILLADEPTGNLDPNNSWEIMKLMEQINENGYAKPFETDGRKIVKVGVIFNTESRTIEDWQIE